MNKLIERVKKNWCGLCYVACGIIMLSVMWLYIERTIAYRSLLLAAFLLIFWFGGKALRVITIFLITAMVLFESHFILHYRALFWGIGDEVLIAAQWAVHHYHTEITNYLNLIRPIEYAGMTGAVALTLFFAVFLRKSRRSRWGLMALPFFLAYCWLSYGEAVWRFYQNGENALRMRLRVDAHKFSAVDTVNPQKSLMLLVIGESQRQDHYSYLITQKYSPLLWRAEKTGNLISFTDITTHATKTLQACLVLLTRASTKFNAKNFHEKSLISAFKEAGYTTHYITYHPALSAYNDGLNVVISEADYFINHAAENRITKNFDTGMLPFVNKIIKENQGKSLIIVHTIGLHFPYSIRFPKSYELFQPTTNNEAKFENRAMIKNNYRNGMLFSGSFLDSLAKLVKEQDYPAAMVFISDHGASLFDDGVNNYLGTCKGNYHVPFFIYGTDIFWQWRGKNAKEMLLQNRDKSLMTDYFFDTALSLMNITYPGFRNQYNLCTENAANAKKRKVYIWNDLVDYDSLANDDENLNLLPIP
jgi:glucan phosphoethanolaminetransferase (alkaline phosphatase superfamily)